MVERIKLTSERIIDGATSLLDRNGLKKFSMRKLAAYLEVDPMAIYYHIPNRTALIALVVDKVVSQCKLPIEVLPWQEAVKSICIEFRKLAHRHPGVIEVYDEFDEWVPGEFRLLESMHAAIEAGGFDRQSTARAAKMLLAYTENFCVWELGDWIRPYTDEMRSEFIEHLELGSYPVTTSLIEELVNVDADSEFEFGLDVQIRGLEQQLGSINI